MDCTRCQELLFEKVEGLLGSVRDAELQAHMAGCDRCAELHSTLLSGADGPGNDFTDEVLERTSRADARRRVQRRLDRDLPALATRMPDADFVADVMAATVEVDRRRLGSRLRALWQQLAQRPRFAMEGAYVGALLVFLLFGTPGAPLAEVPRRALAPFSQEGAVRVTLSDGAEHVTRLSRATWRRTGELLTTSHGADNGNRAGLLTTWRQRAGTLLGALWDSTLGPAFEWIRRAWLEITARTPAPTDATTTRRGDGHGNHHAA